MDYHPRMLIVEDDKLVIDNCRRALRDHRVEIKDAMRAQDAIELLQKDCFAAVFVDLEIPGMRESIYGGFEVLQCGRELNAYTEMVVITEHKEEEVLSRVWQHDVSLCIGKPVDYREILFAAQLLVSGWEKRIDRLFGVLEGFSVSHGLLAARKHNRPNVNVTNEYDVQDLLHVILKPFYPDIAPEEYTPKRAGQQKRIDLVIKGLQTVVEIKMIRSKAHAKRVTDELDVDIANYPTHPSCRRLMCFVYDPKQLIGDPRGIEKDLSREVTQKGKTIDVAVVVRPG